MFPNVELRQFQLEHIKVSDNLSPLDRSYLYIDVRVLMA
jgi:hypothetical protein